MSVLSQRVLPILAGVLLIFGQKSFGFSMGYHCDIISEVLEHEGFSDRTIRLVMAANEYTDIFGTDESYMLLDPSQYTEFLNPTHYFISTTGIDNDELKWKIKPLADFFHSTQTITWNQIKKYLEMLIQNTNGFYNYNIQKLDQESYISYARMLIALGISLHCMQDLYAHSNWAELNWSPYTKKKDATFFDLYDSDSSYRSPVVQAFLNRGFPKSSNGIYTNFTNVYATAPQHDDMKKDYASQANFDDAYCAAFKATLQWVRWIESKLGPHLDDFRNFQWNPSDQALNAFTGYSSETGTARYMCMYGGAWKHWKLWSHEAIAMSAPNIVEGIDIINTTLFDRPFLYDIWRPVCLRLAHGIFHIRLNNDSCDMIDTTHNLIPNSQIVVDSCLFDNLPPTLQDTVNQAIVLMTNDTFEREYAQVTWLKFATPYWKDRDNGDGLINWNDEEKNGTSDYYAEWFVGPENAMHHYVESIYENQDDPVANSQILKPCWSNTPVKVRLKISDSDKIDPWKAMFQRGLLGAGLLQVSATTVVALVLPFPSLIAALSTYFSWQNFWTALDGPGDEDMDVSPSSSKYDLEFTIDPTDLKFIEIPAACTTNTHFHHTSYGIFISCWGNDDEESVMTQLQISKRALTTKVRIDVLEEYRRFPIDDQDDDCDDQPYLKWNMKTWINHNDFPQRSYDYTYYVNHIPGGNIWEARSNPCTQVSYESYIDDSVIPIRLDLTTYMKKCDYENTSSFGPGELKYHLKDHSITNNKNQIIGYSGDVITFKNAIGDWADSARVKITVEDDSFAPPIPRPTLLFVKYACLDPVAPSDNQIKPSFQIFNNSDEDIPLQQLTLRYWYTAEGYQQQICTVDMSSQPAASAIKGKYVPKANMTGSDGYFVIGFTENSGVLHAHDSTSIIQMRFNKCDWKQYNETGDYSYDPSKTTLALHPKITLYHDGALMYGEEPNELPVDQKPVPSVEVWAMDEGIRETNIVKPRIYVRNTGLITIPRFEIRYHFTVENGKTPILENYYTPLSTVSLVDKGNGNYYISYIVECLGFGSGSVYPDENGNAVGIHYSDWSNLNKANDYSNPGSGTFIPTDKIEIIFLPYSPPVPPSQQQPVPSVLKYIKDEGFSESNIVKPRIYIHNLGSAPITGTVDIKYYFTVENDKTPIVEGYYLPQANISLEQVNQNIFCVRLHITDVSLASGAILPNTDGYVFGIHYTDWSEFNKSNDPSNPGSANWVQTNSIDVVQ